MRTLDPTENENFTDYKALLELTVSQTLELCSALHLLLSAVKLSSTSIQLVLLTLQLLSIPWTAAAAAGRRCST